MPAGRQSLCDVQLTPLPSLSVTAAAAGRGEGGGADWASQMLGKHETKGPSRRYAWIHWVNR